MLVVLLLLCYWKIHQHSASGDVSSRVRHILVTLKTCGVVASPYMGMPRPYAIYGHNPPPETDVT